MENYKKRLAQYQTLEEMLAEAPNDHRLQKLLVAYMMKDKATYNKMVRLAKTNPYAKTLVDHAKATVSYVSSRRTPEWQELSGHLKNVVRVGRGRPSVSFKKVSKPELDGYTKMLNNYLCEKRMENAPAELKAKVEARMKDVDFNNLVLK